LAAAKKENLRVAEDNFESFHTAATKIALSISIVFLPGVDDHEATNYQRS